MNSLVAEVIQVIRANVSGLGGISPSPVPVDAKFPYITVGEINTMEAESLEGRSGLARSLIQIECWSKSHECAWSTRRIVYQLLTKYRGQAGTQVIKWVNPNVDAMLYDGNRSLHQAITRLFVWWDYD